MCRVRVHTYYTLYTQLYAKNGKKAPTCVSQMLFNHSFFVHIFLLCLFCRIFFSLFYFFFWHDGGCIRCTYIFVLVCICVCALYTYQGHLQLRLKKNVSSCFSLVFFPIIHCSVEVLWLDISLQFKYMVCLCMKTFIVHIRAAIYE